MPAENEGLFAGSGVNATVFDALFDALLLGVQQDAAHTTTFTGTTTSSSATVSSLSSVQNLQVGMLLVGPNIPSNTTILRLGDTFLVMSQNATGSGTGTISASMYAYTWTEQDFNVNSGAAYTPPGARCGNFQQQAAWEENNELALSPISFTGTSHSTTTIDGISATTGIAVGMTVTGTGIVYKTPTYVTAVAANSITLSQAAVTSTTTTFTVCTPILVQIRYRTSVAGDSIYEFTNPGSAVGTATTSSTNWELTSDGGIIIVDGDVVSDSASFTGPVSFSSYLIFAPISVSIVYGFWWDSTTDRPMFKNGTATYPLGLDVESGTFLDNTESRVHTDWMVFDNRYFKVFPNGGNALQADITFPATITGPVKFDKGNPPVSSFVPPTSTVDPPTGTDDEGAQRQTVNGSDVNLYVQVQNTGGGTGNTWKKIATTVAGMTAPVAKLFYPGGVTLSGNPSPWNPPIIFSLQSGDTILTWDGVDPKTWGIWVVNLGGAWTRDPSMPAGKVFTGPAYVWVADLLLANDLLTEQAALMTLAPDWKSTTTPPLTLQWTLGTDGVRAEFASPIDLISGSSGITVNHGSTGINSNLWSVSLDPTVPPTLADQGGTPAAPAAGDIILYNDGGDLYIEDSSGDTSKLPTSNSPGSFPRWVKVSVLLTNASLTSGSGVNVRTFAANEVISQMKFVLKTALSVSGSVGPPGLSVFFNSSASPGTGANYFGGITVISLGGSIVTAATTWDDVNNGNSSVCSPSGSATSLPGGSTWNLQARWSNAGGGPDSSPTGGQVDVYMLIGTVS